MRHICLAFCGGVLLAHQLPVLPPTWVPLSLLVLLTPLLRLSLFRAVWFLLAGVGLVVVSAQAALSDRLSAGEDGRVQTVQGRIIGVPAAGERDVRFLFRPLEPDLEDLPKRVRVRWFQAPIVPEAGSVWQLKLRLASPYQRVNPGVPDIERYYFANRIGATAQVVGAGDNRQLEKGRGLHNWRQRLGRWVRLRIADEDASALAVALTVGDRQLIDPQLRERLLVTGTAHLVAISGLHVGLVAGGTWLTCAALLRFVALPAKRWPATLLAIPPALAAAVIYSALAGFALPTQRALIMVTFGFLAVFLRRGTSPWNVLLYALCAVLLLDPLAPLGAGFWLSFGAVATLIYLAAGHSSAATSVESFGRVQLALLVALAPITLWWFGRIAWLAPLANAFAIPLVGSLVVPLLLTGVMLGQFSEALGGFLVGWAGWLLELLDHGLAMLASLNPGADIRAVPPFWVMLPVCLGVVTVLTPVALPVRLCGLLLVALPLAWKPAPIPEGGAVVVLADVGHGHALLIRTRRHALLYDTGPAWFGRDLARLLIHHGVRRPDAVVLSNDRAGSIGGADAALLDGATRIGPDQDITCADAAGWHWDGVELRFIRNASGADAGCLLMIDAGGDRLLVAHAVSRAGAAHVAAGALDPVRWVIAPVHGHGEAVPSEFAARLGAETVFVPIDRNNRFGLPHEQALLDWDRAGTRTVTTGESGAVTIRLGGDGSGDRTARGTGRYWLRH